jgi:hypothetical protein
MEEALERQQETAEARRARKHTSSPEERERKAKKSLFRILEMRNKIILQRSFESS